MKDQQDIQRKIDEAMRSVTGIPPVESNPFLYEKIKDRIKADEIYPETTQVFNRPALRIAAVCLLLLMNAWFIGNYGFSASSGDTVTDANVEYIIDSYQIMEDNNSIYN